jgi:hypothetical protein
MLPPAATPEQSPAPLEADVYVVPLVAVPSKLPPVNSGFKMASVQTLA